jgi:hypothetical protein
MHRLFAALIMAFIAILAVACSTVIPAPTEDTAYLTPIPEATLHAFNYDVPITNKLQAAIHAIRARGVHFGFIGTPKVISVEELPVSELLNRGITSVTDLAADTRVWFVVLEGEIQINPPDPLHTVTPPPPFHGCNYVILEILKGDRATGGIDCPTQTP